MNETLLGESLLEEIQGAESLWDQQINGVVDEIFSGMGKTVDAKALKKVIKGGVKAVNRQQVRKLAVNTSSNAMLQLLQKVPQLPREIQDAARKGLLEVRDTHYYWRRTLDLASSSNQIQLITGSMKQMAGICNAQGNQIAAGENFLCTGVRLSYTPYYTNTVNFANINYQDTNLASAYYQNIQNLTAAGLYVVPSQLLNADFTFSVGEGIIYRMPVNEMFVRGSFGALNYVDGPDYITLQQPKLIQQQLVLGATINVTDSNSIPPPVLPTYLPAVPPVGYTLQHALEIQLRGMALVLRGANIG